jgi:ornithine cyclodeaminase
VLGARYLARADSRELLIVGAGTVARNLIPAYAAVFPELSRIRIVSRSGTSAERLASAMAPAGYPTEAAADLEAALATADIVATATTARTPMIHGESIRTGTHVDLVGAFAADMREADDAVLQRGEVFVDSHASTRHHIGEIKIPIETGAIAESDIRGDLYDLRVGTAGRSGPDAITVFKNGGGAHLDLMVADLMVRRCIGDAGRSAVGPA